MSECWLCGRNGSSDPLDHHHIFGGPNRKLSEKYGLVVLLCHDRCHENGKYAAHKNKDTRDRLRDWGQRKAMEEQGWTVDDFREVFGKNYLIEDEVVADTFDYYFDSENKNYVITKNGNYFLCCTSTESDAKNIVELLRKDSEKANERD